MSALILPPTSSGQLHDLGLAAKNLGPSAGSLGSDLEEAAEELRHAARHVLRALQRGMPPAEAFEFFREDVTSCVQRLTATLFIARELPSLREVLEQLPAAHRTILHRMRGEHVADVVEDVDACLDVFVEIVQLLQRAARSGHEPSFDDEFVLKSFWRQGAIIVGLEVLDTLAEGDAADHGLALRLSAFMAAAAREHFEAVAAVFGMTSEPSLDIRTLESAETSRWTTDQEDVTALRKHLG